MGNLRVGNVRVGIVPWWRYQMETFSALLALCAGNSPSPVPGEFLTQRPVTRSFDVFIDLRLNKRLSKQSWGWWFETPSHSLWCHCNGGWGFVLVKALSIIVTYIKTTNDWEQYVTNERVKHCQNEWIYLISEYIWYWLPRVKGHCGE